MGQNSPWTGEIDWKRFGERVGQEIAKTNLSTRELAAVLEGPAHSTLWKVGRGEMSLSAETYLWFCREFSIDPFWAYTPDR